jgi:tetratricopeptide (TPR) repeat protein
MTAVAMLCALLPRAVCGMQVARNWLPILKLAGASIASLWLGLAVANIRITLPLWSNDIRLWNWALQQNPGLAMARSHLLAALIEANDLPQARQVADMLIEHDSTCLDCMLNVAAFAVQERDLPRLQTALTGAKKLFGKSPNPRVLQAYIIATGQMHEMQGDAQEAADAYQGAIRLEPLDPKARMDMALLLVRNGDVNQGRVFMRKALALFPVDERSRRQKQFEDVVAASTARPATD